MRVLKLTPEICTILEIVLKNFTTTKTTQETIEEKNERLQDEVDRIEVDAHEQAGDMSWPPEAIERR